MIIKEDLFLIIAMNMKKNMKKNLVLIRQGKRQKRFLKKKKKSPKQNVILYIFKILSSNSKYDIE